MFADSKIYLLKSGLPLLLTLLFVVACGDDADGTDDPTQCENNCEGDDAGHIGDTDGSDASGNGDASGNEDASGNQDATADATNPDEHEPVHLGGAGDFVILAKTSISTASASDVTGDMGISPAAATYITDFSLIADATNVFSTSSQVTGQIYASDYEPPTPSNLTSAVGAMETAFSDAASRAAHYTEEAAGAIGGLTLEPGTYKWGTDVSIADDLTLEGSATNVWIFQVAGDLSIASAARVNLTGGALAKNVFWQVSGKAEFGTTSHFEGVVMCQTGITLKTGASINGRLLAQTAVSLDANAVVEPAQ